MSFLKAKPSEPQIRNESACSFCGRIRSVTGWMVEGPSDIYICSRCTDTAIKLYAARGVKLPLETVVIQAPDFEPNT